MMQTSRLQAAHPAGSRIDNYKEISLIIKKVQDIYLKSYKDKISFVNFLKTKDNYTDIFSDAFITRLLGCGSFLRFRYFFDTDKTKLKSANFCKSDKLCVPCAIRRAYKQQNRFIDVLHSHIFLLAQNWYYIVLPVRHTSDESFSVVFNRLNFLRKSFSMSIRNKKRYTGNNFWSDISGGVYSIETTHTQNGWNIHFNLLVNTSKKLQLVKCSDFTKSWYQSDSLSDWLISHTENNSYIHSINHLDFSSDELIKTNLLEVLKYSLKFSSLSHSHLFEFFSHTYKNRLIGSFGNLWGLKIFDVNFDDTDDDSQFIDFLYYRLGLFYVPLRQTTLQILCRVGKLGGPA